MSTKKIMDIKDNYINERKQKVRMGKKAKVDIAIVVTVLIGTAFLLIGDKYIAFGFLLLAVIIGLFRRTIYRHL